MSEIAIRVEGLGKSYRITHTQGHARYRTLQEDLLVLPRRLWSWGRGANDRRETFWALKNVSFEVKQGEVLGIIGRNGAGKSTLLKILSRITEPTKGRAEIYGRVGSLLEVGTGFHPELTGRENIYLSGAVLGMTHREVRRKFDEIVAFAEIEKFIDTPAKHYSSGMYMRLAFAVAAHLEPEILLVDEVLAVGDAEFQKKCLGKMGDVAKAGRTILFVSHNMSAINQLCPTSVLVEAGKVVKRGPSAEIVNHYLSGMGSAQKSSQQQFLVDKNKAVQIRKVAIRDHNGALTEFVDLNEEFTIQVDYAFTESLANVSIGCQIISDENNQCIISLSDPELDASRLNKREIGYYQSTVAIPAKILNTGIYHVRLGASNRFREIYDVVDNIPLTVVDSKGIVLSLGYERKNALLSMQLPWHVTRLKSETGL